MTGQKERKPIARTNAGFTLIEVLLVVAILGILAGVVVVNFSGKGKGARIKATRSSIHAICMAIDMYEVDIGRFPSSLQGLVSSDGGQNWSGPYLRGGVPADSWGTPFNYSSQGNGYKVVSAGPDLATGSSDDITSFEM
jgi:general secretion pathway protein G